LYGRPVSGVGTDINVELDVAGRAQVRFCIVSSVCLWLRTGQVVLRTVGSKLVLEADIKGSIGVGGKSHSRLPNEVFRLAIFIPYCVPDLKFRTASAT